MKTVGIVINPVSGTDLRRLVAAAATTSHVEKVNMVVRILRSLAALGVRQVRISPDANRLAERAVEAAGKEIEGMNVAPLELPWLIGRRLDTDRVVARMRELDFGCILVLGGDGTCRAVACACGEIPLIAISTGTNNAFPRMIEGTLAGMAAAAYISGAACSSEVVKRAPKLDLYADDELMSTALVDIAIIDTIDTGSGVVDNEGSVRELFLAQARTDSIGLSAIGGCLSPLDPYGGLGLYIEIGDSDEDCTTNVIAPMAPGMLRRFPIRESGVFDADKVVKVRSKSGTFAFDGERELLLDGDKSWSVSINPEGPWVINVQAALTEATKTGFFRTKLTVDDGVITSP